MFLTGSSAALLSREIATAMRGRAWEVVIHPFSFEEALRHQGRSVPEPAGLSRCRAGSRWNGPSSTTSPSAAFPRRRGWTQPRGTSLLRDYVDVAMLRDVVERHAVSNVAGLRWLVRHLLGNAAGTVQRREVLRGAQVTGPRHLQGHGAPAHGHLEDCFLVRTVWMEAASERQRMVNPRKAYPVDPGLIPVFDRTGRANLGHALETAVLIELERRRAEITYVSTPQGLEVDFLAGFAGSKELIQVCSDASAPDTAERELRALIEAGGQFPQARKRLLTLMGDGLPRAAPTDVQAQPAYVWLLTPSADSTQNG